MIRFISRTLSSLRPRRRWQVSWKASFEPFGRPSGVYLTRRQRCWTKRGAERFSRWLVRQGVYGDVARA